MANVDFEFDFSTKIAKSYTDHYQDVADLAKGHDLGSVSTEKLIRELISINSTVLAEVLTEYSHELLNEI